MWQRKAVVFKGNRRMSESLLHRLAWIIVALCVAPILASALAAFTGDLDTWRNVLSSVLPRYTATTLILLWWWWACPRP